MKYAWQISALIVLFAVLAVWMPERDKAHAAAPDTAATAFYRDCMPQEGYETRVTASAGYWSCPKHQIIGYGMARH